MFFAILEYQNGFKMLTWSQMLKNFDKNLDPLAILNPQLLHSRDATVQHILYKYCLINAEWQTD